MRVDTFDHTLICESDDLQTILSYFKENRKVSESVEAIVLHEVFTHIFGRTPEAMSIEACLELLPDAFVQSTIADIQTLFMNPSQELSYKHHHLSYLLYYLPGNLFKVWKPLLDLQLRNALKVRMRVLDIGTGPGSIPMGIIEYYTSLAESFPHLNFALSWVLIEREQKFLEIALGLLQRIRRALPVNMTVAVETALCENVMAWSDYDQLGEFDLITLSNFFTWNENLNLNRENGISILEKLRQNLRADGSLILIEPGDKASGTSLKALRNEVMARHLFTYFSPCVGILEEKSTYDCNCFSMARSYWDLPKIYQFLLKKGLRKGKRENIPFNYLIFRKDNLKKYSLARNPRFYTKLCDLKDKVGQNVTVMARIRTVIDRGNQLTLFLCDGTCSFQLDYGDAIRIDLAQSYLQENRMTFPLIAGERITLKQVRVTREQQSYSLHLQKDSRVIVEY